MYPDYRGRGQACARPRTMGCGPAPSFTGTGSGLPNYRVSTAVEDCENDDAVALGPKVNAEWKSTRRHTARVVVDDSVYLRLFRGECYAPLDFGDEFRTKVWTLGFVPGCCLKELGPGGMAERNRKAHRPIRPRADALTSSHGTTSSGFAS